eukprot:11767607-Karenia_brevis.AAC.1
MVRCKSRDCNAQQRKNRIKCWEAWVQDAWKKQQKDVFQWCRGGIVGRAAMVERPDGTFTANSDEIDDLVRRAWMPIFR